MKQRIQNIKKVHTSIVLTLPRLLIVRVLVKVVVGNIVNHLNVFLEVVPVLPFKLLVAEFTGYFFQHLVLFCVRVLSVVFQ